jgi:phosphatidylglycerol---prolipoprotein diacylglyceryl transferase
MRPVLWHWCGLSIPSYPAMLYLGLVCGVAASNVAAHAAQLAAGRVFVATLVLLIPALLGARLLFVLTHWDLYRADPGRIWRRAQSGGALYGGVPCALFASVPLLWALQLPFWAFWDVATFTVLIGLIFTRVGCLLHGCCAGRPSASWVALRLPDHTGAWERRLPSPVFEMVWASILLLGALLLWGRRPFSGALILFLLGGYGLGRFWMERTRAQQDIAAGLALHSAISAALIGIAAVGFIVAWP